MLEQALAHNFAVRESPLCCIYAYTYLYPHLSMATLSTNSVDRQNQTHAATHNICGLYVPRRRCPVVPLSLRLKRESELQASSCVLMLLSGLTRGQWCAGVVPGPWLTTSRYASHRSGVYAHIHTCVYTLYPHLSMATPSSHPCSQANGVLGQALAHNFAVREFPLCCII